jgi:hypothetical protein
MSTMSRGLYRNYVSLAGGVIAAASFVTDVFLLLIDFLAPHQNPYVGILTYLILPGLTLAGLGLLAAGAWLQSRRRRRGLPVAELPRLDLGNPRHRLVLAGAVVGGLIFLSLSAVGGYQTYHFSDSVAFCGQVCHAVMRPEFTAYQHSPHARVACVTCHIGPGAEWFVRAKLSGAYQVYSVLFEKYSRPIPTPIHNLRPAQDTCEQCHWPAKFWGEQLATRVHFASDARNTRRDIHLLIKTGGGSEKGISEGIHWHMNIASKIFYLPADERRQVIPWVRAERPDGQVIEYVSTDNPLPPGALDRGPIRRMDCVDCHNRPSHRFLPPGRALDLSLQAGRLPADLPYIKKVGVDAMVQTYATAAEADRGIDRHVRDFYGKAYPDLVRAEGQKLGAAIDEIRRAYHENFFPEMRVSWQAYPDNIGHKEFPGCFRCHDGRHVSRDGEVISKDCASCHDFLERKGTGSFVPAAATPAFAHPWPLGGKHTEILCGACHTGGPAKPATCRGCHQIPATGVPMADMACKDCHRKEQEVQPLESCGTCHGGLAGLHRPGAHGDAGCVACHAPHAWAPAARDTCLACHGDRAEHNPGETCAGCHAFR